MTEKEHRALPKAYPPEVRGEKTAGGFAVAKE